MPAISTSQSGFPTTSELGHILKLALPLVLAYLGRIVIGLTDSAMIGRLGPDELGATGLALSVYRLIQTVGFGLLFPVMVMASHAGGVGRSRTVRVIIRQGLWIAGILSIPACAILWNLEEILLLTGQSPRLAEIAGHYMDYFLWTIFPLFASFVFIFAFTVMGQALAVTLIMWFAVVLHAILDYVLIFGNFGAPAMGVAGAGLAGVIAYIAIHMAFFILLAFHRFFRSTVVFRRVWRPRWTMLKEFFRIGWPRSLQGLLMNTLFSVTALLAGWLGTEAIASHTVAFQIRLLVTHVMSWAIASAIATRMGAARGRKDYDSMWSTLNGGFLLFLLFILLPVILLKLFSPWMVMLFTGSGLEAQTLIPFAAPLLVFVAFFILVDGLHLVLDHALVGGLADTKIPALITTVCYWGVGLPAGMVLGFVLEFGVLGLWWGLTLGVMAAVTLDFLRFRWVVRGIRASSGTEKDIEG
uniref:Multidrug-efflux transporter n=1 Tax=Candidatus Kentrum sp. FW TaxID=2126338 RepID=A0A450TZC5_9GAMM|nr:MAG: multidrug resistance protein, MATE family [Candidatus Kentron sp. FW]